MGLAGVLVELPHARGVEITDSGLSDLLSLHGEVFLQLRALCHNEVAFLTDMDIVPSPPPAVLRQIQIDLGTRWRGTEVYCKFAKWSPVINVGCLGKLLQKGHPTRIPRQVE